MAYQEEILVGFDAAKNGAMTGHNKQSASDADGRIANLTSVTHRKIDALAEKAEPVLNDLRKTAHEATDRLRERADQAAELHERGLTACRETVRERPMTSILVGFALGALLSSRLFPQSRR